MVSGSLQVRLPVRLFQLMQGDYEDLLLTKKATRHQTSAWNAPSTSMSVSESAVMARTMARAVGSTFNFLLVHFAERTHLILRLRSTSRPAQSQ